jgi:hypothetical protein
LFISDSPQDIAELFPIRQEKQVVDNQINWVEESGKKPLDEILEAFAQALVRYFCDFFDSKMKGAAAYPPDVYFSIIHARKISRNIKHLTLDNIEQLIGNEMLTGQFKMLFDHITLFQSTNSYQYISRRQEELDAELNLKAARLRKGKEVEDNQRAEATRATREAAAQKKIDTAARVKANAEKKRTAKEAKLIESEKKKAKRESDMAFLHQLQAQAEIDQQNMGPDASDPETSKSLLVDESMDPALL